VQVWYTFNLRWLRLGEDKRRKIEGRNLRTKLECGPMPNVMADQPNVGGALCM